MTNTLRDGDRSQQAGAGSQPEALRGEVLVCGCRHEDVALLRTACGSEGPRIRTVSKPVEMAREAVRRPPVAVVLGLRRRDRARLQMIPVIRAAWNELPVIVIADEDSLELERRARQAGIFYYFVHPLGSTEVQAVLKDLLRRAGRTAAGHPASRKEINTEKGSDS